MADPRFADFEARITALEIKAGIKKAAKADESADVPSKGRGGKVKDSE